ncbi:Bacterial inner membrane protein [Shewanella psychrophila]|uniref:Bacterial inner membrane protein n=1 Tax=Shewanella psychrophila TaxID=225848 RepID=A0A1S6HQU7_9GAMM|nr:YgjV family protein [Shewanella psychrophila]AQS37906.1 Bacterial inner membrane protein [Shewanella psychrophila]
MSAFAISQVLIAIAIIFDLISFQFKQRKKILTCLCISGILISSHFFLLEQWTAAILMLLASIRYLVTVFSHSKSWMMFFLAASSLVTLVTFSGILSLISFAGSATQTCAAFCPNDQRLRQMMLIGTSIWLLNNTLIGSPTAVLMEVLFIGSNLLGYYRYYGFTLSSKYEQA